MTTTAMPGVGPSAALQVIGDALDLTGVRRKLAEPEEGEGYSQEQLDVMEGEYHKFLALHIAFPEADIVPCKIVDTIWHQHILDTKAYRADCDRLLGRFLDHYPYFGMRDEEDAQALVDAYEDTLARYESAFGPPPDETWISTRAGRCRTACKPVKCR
jgi:hypothetical protein